MNNPEKSGQFHCKQAVGVNPLLRVVVNQSQTWGKTIKMKYEARKINKMTGEVIEHRLHPTVPTDPESVIGAISMLLEQMAFLWL